MENLKVVIVDDSPFSISIIKDILEEKGFKVVGEAGNLQEVIEVVKNTKPSIVTMDMTLPDTDGIQCTRAIHEIDKSIKVVVVSSMMDDEIVKEAKKNKISGYIQKPVDPEELISVIEKIAHREELFENLEKIHFEVFKESFADSVNKFTKTITNFGEVKKSHKPEASRGISVAIGIIGNFSGRMVLDLSHSTAKEIAKIVLKREAKDEDEMLNLIAEFANIIAGNACSMLNRKNKVFGLRVAPPTIFYGESLSISHVSLYSTSVVAETKFGEVYLNVGFKRGENEWM